MYAVDLLGFGASDKPKEIEVQRNAQILTSYVTSRISATLYEMFGLGGGRDAIRPRNQC